MSPHVSTTLENINRFLRQAAPLRPIWGVLSPTSTVNSVPTGNVTISFQIEASR